MDLFGKKSKALLAQVVTRAEQLEYEKNIVLQQAAELYRVVQARDSLVYDLIGENNRLKQVVADWQVREQAPAPPKLPPHHVSEEESELKWQLDQGYINLSDYENILKELEFQNAEIAIDPDFRLPPNTAY